MELGCSQQARAEAACDARQAPHLDVPLKIVGSLQRSVLILQDAQGLLLHGGPLLLALLATGV